MNYGHTVESDKNANYRYFCGPNCFLELCAQFLVTRTWILFPRFDINTLRPRQNGRHFPDAIFKRIFLNQNEWISIKISLKFVPNVPINNIPALVQIMAWRRSGDKPLSEPMMDSLLTHIRVTRTQWVKMCMLLSSTLTTVTIISLVFFFLENEHHSLGWLKATLLFTWGGDNFINSIYIDNININMI